MNILYEDRHLILCEKPIGVLSQKGREGEADMLSLLEAYFAEKGERETAHVLHRLDEAVGGVMVYAKNQKSAAHFSKLIQDGLLIKEYVAMVHGTPEPEGELEDLLFKDSRKNKVFVVKKQRAGVKKARLSYKLMRAAERSLVRIRLYTGRSHQIRVQFSSRGFPLVGDHKYGSRDEEKAPMLYSCCITLPYKGQTRQFSHFPQWMP